MALALYDSSGHHADQITKPAGDFEIIDTITDVLRVHGIDTVDVETDVEDIFKALHSLPGMSVRLMLSSELRYLYDLLAPNSNIWPLLAELYAIEDAPAGPKNEAPTHVKEPSWKRLIKYVEGLIKRWKR